MPDEVNQARAAAWLRDSLGEAPLEWALALDPALGGEVSGASVTHEAILAASHGASLCASGAVTRGPNLAALTPEELELRRRETQDELAALLRGLLAGPAGP